MRRFGALLMLVGGLSMAGGASAAVTVNITESGPNVIVTATGTLSTSGLTFNGTTQCDSFLAPGAGDLAAGAANTACDYYSSGASTLGAFGSGGRSAAPNSGSGFFATALGAIFVPAGFSSGGSIYANSTFLGASFSSLGLTPGIYTVTWPGDSMTLIIGVAPASVPTFSELSQMLLGLMVLSIIGWHFLKQRSY